MSLASIKSAIVKTAANITSKIVADKVDAEVNRVTDKINKSQEKLDKYGVELFDPEDAINAISKSITEAQDSQQDIRKKLDEKRKSLTEKIKDTDHDTIKNYTTGICNRKQDGFATAVVDGVINELTPESITNPEATEGQNLDAAAASENTTNTPAETEASEDKSALATVTDALKDAGKGVFSALTGESEAAGGVVDSHTSPLTSAISDIMGGDASNPSKLSAITAVATSIATKAESTALGVIKSDLTGMLGEAAVQKTVGSVGRDISELMAEPTINEVRNNIAIAAEVKDSSNTSIESIAQAIDEVATAKASEEGNVKAVEKAVSEQKLISYCSGSSGIKRVAKECKQTQENIVSTIATAEALGVNLDDVSDAKIKEPTEVDNKAPDLIKLATGETVPEDPLAEVFDDTVDLVEFKALIANGTAMAKIILGQEKFDKCMAMLQAEEARNAVA